MARRLRSQHRRRAADQIRPRPHREPAQRCQGSPHQEQTTGNYRLISPCASARGPRRMDTSILRAANVPIIGGHHVLALQSSPEGWQATPLLERCREHAGRRGRVVQRHVLYLGEINDTQELAWRRSIAVLEDGAAQPRTLSLFPEDRCEGLLADASIVRVKLSELRLRRPRQWGACWLALLLWRELQLDLFWSKRLGSSRKGTRWDQVLFVLAAHRLLAPGSEWRLHPGWV